MLFSEAPRDVIDRIEQGAPGDFDTSTIKFKREFRDEVAAVNAWGKNAEDFLEMMRKNPGGNTLIAAATNFGNRLMGEVRTLAGQGLIEFDDDFRGLELSKWEQAFSAAGLAGANPRIKNGFLALAIQRASAMGMGEGRALSDKDVEFQLQTLGENQNDPNIVANIFNDSYKMMRNRSESRAEQHPELRAEDYSFYEPNFGQAGSRIRTWIPGQGFVEE